jgi:ABC-type branched-subunit amino acid transport system ATPase component
VSAVAAVAEPMLVVEGVTGGYVPEVDILRGVDAQVRRGEIVTLVGPNGAGKSTLLKSVFGLLRPRRGSIRLHDEEIAGERPHLINRRGVGYVPQLENVFPTLTVQENLELGAVGAALASIPQRLEALYGLFPRLRDRRRQQAGTMSGGERQMVAMARSLVPEPELLLLDEPTAGLAPEYVEAIFELVTEINRNGVTVLMVEQNARRALELSHRGYVLDLGATCFEGKGRELMSDPKVAELYLGGGSRAERATEAD